MKYAKIDSTNTNPQAVIGWFDADALDYPSENFTSADFVKMTDAQWAARIDNPYYDQSAKTFGKPPAPTAAQKLQAAKDAKLAELSAAYENAIQQPVSFTSADGSTKMYQADKASRDNLQDMLSAFAKAGATPSGFYWVAQDNTQVPFTYADLQGLAEAMGTQGNTAFQHLQSLKSQVNAVTTSTSSPITTVQGISW